MNARILRLSLLFAAVSISVTGILTAQTTDRRTLKICVAADAPFEIKQSAERIHAGISTSPLLSLFGANGVTMEDSAALLSGNIEGRAYHHLILVGLPTDPLIQAAWQREAKIEDGGFYIFGFGHLHGTLGYIESDRNPFLHSEAVVDAPYETEVITITGSSPAGIDLAVSAFLQSGLVNGVVAAPGWTRPSTTLLDRPPLELPIDPLPDAPLKAGNVVRIGVTQAEESEYRDVLQDTGITPSSIWRVKYTGASLWGPAEKFEKSSMLDYLNGLDRRAFGQTLWIAQYPSPHDAAAAAGKIAESAQMQKQGSKWTGNGPWDKSSAATATTPNPLSMQLVLWVSGNKVLLSNVPGLSN